MIAPTSSFMGGATPISRERQHHDAKPSDRQGNPHLLSAVIGKYVVPGEQVGVLASTVNEAP